MHNRSKEQNGTSKNGLPENEKYTYQQNTFNKYEKKGFTVLCRAHTVIWQQIMHNEQTNNKIAGGYRDVV